jgi:hypothetical protein
MNSTDFPSPFNLGAALTKMPPPRVANVKQAIPRVAVAETE